MPYCAILRSYAQRCPFLTALSNCTRIRLALNPLPRNGIMSMSDKLFTVGYQGRCFDEFLNLLRQNSIDTVVDVRYFPHSRKRGFSKSTLSERLNSDGIQYMHLRKLGSPPGLRRRYQKHEDINTYFNEYRRHLDGQLSTLEHLARLSRRESSCLLCLEAEPLHCHRSVIAEKIQQLDGNGLAICHL